MPVHDISVADLRLGISTVIATEMVLQWNSGPKSAERHQRLLEPYKVCGTVASSDSAGLSRLTQAGMAPQQLPTFFLVDKNNVLYKRDAQIKNLDAEIQSLL